MSRPAAWRRSPFSTWSPLSPCRMVPPGSTGLTECRRARHPRGSRDARAREDTRLNGKMATFEFHVSRRARDRYQLDDALFTLSGNVVFANFRAARVFAQKMNEQ